MRYAVLVMVSLDLLKHRALRDPLGPGLGSGIPREYHGSACLGCPRVSVSVDRV
jgi:hypothetical protein